MWAYRGGGGVLGRITSWVGGVFWGRGTHSYIYIYICEREKTERERERESMSMSVNHEVYKPLWRQDRFCFELSSRPQLQSIDSTAALETMDAMEPADLT